VSAYPNHCEVINKLSGLIKIKVQRSFLTSHGAILETQLFFVVNTQQEFWRREFGGLIVEKDEGFLDSARDLINRGVRPIIQIDNNLEELSQLKTLPKDSIIGWCHSDEKFEIAFNKELANIDAFKFMLRPYRLEKTNLLNSLRSLVYTLSNLKSANNLVDVLRTFRWQLRGYSMQFRQARILKMNLRKNKKFYNMPIGYTNIFALSLASKLQVSPNQSLISSIELPDAFLETKISFVGQSGQIVREFAIRAAESNEFGFVVRRSSYGASNVIDSTVFARGNDYVSQIAASRFVLSPPGNISGESFRTYEAIVMSRIPLVLDHVTSDPNFKSDYKYLNAFKSKRNWRRFLEEATKIDAGIFHQIVKKNSEAAKSEVEVLKRILTEANMSQ
jgi:hypothetical protein